MADQIPVLHILALGRSPKVRLGKHLLPLPICKTLVLLIYLAINVGLQPKSGIDISLCNTLAHQKMIFRRSVGHWMVPCDAVETLSYYTNTKDFIAKRVLAPFQIRSG